jgi:hypothetical protein
MANKWGNFFSTGKNKHKKVAVTSGSMPSATSNTLAF